MEETSENISPDLQRIEREIEKILSNENLPNEKAEFYKALKTVIRLKVDTEELQYKFGKFQKVFTAMAVGDFTERMDIPNNKNLFSYFGISINAVIEELKINVVKRQYLEASLEYIPHIAIITDKSGSILYANSNAVQALGKRKEDIISLRIANIFKSKKQFGIANPDFSAFEDVGVAINFLNTSIDVNLTVKEVHNRLGETDGYLYIAKS